MIPFNRTPKWLFQTGVYYTLSRSALMVLGCLTDCIDSREYAGNIRTTTVVTKTGLSKQSVCAALSELIEAGIVRREKGQARFTICTQQEVKHALPRSSTVDLNGQAHLTKRSSTVDHEVKHALPPRGRNKDSPRTSYQELNTKNDYQEEQPAAVSGPEIDQQRVYRAIQILNAQTDASGKPIWRPFTNKVRMLADQWVLHNHRDPDELPDLIQYGLGKAKGNAGAYIAKIIEAGDWEPNEGIPEDPDKAAKMELIRRAREARKTGQE